MIEPGLVVDPSANCRKHNQILGSQIELFIRAAKVKAPIGLQLPLRVLFDCGDGGLPSPALALIPPVDQPNRVSRSQAGHARAVSAGGAAVFLRPLRQIFGNMIRMFPHRDPRSIVCSTAGESKSGVSVMNIACFRFCGSGLHWGRRSPPPMGARDGPRRSPANAAALSASACPAIE